MDGSCGCGGIWGCNRIALEEKNQNWSVGGKRGMGIEQSYSSKSSILAMKSITSARLTSRTVAGILKSSWEAMIRFKDNHDSRWSADLSMFTKF